MGPQEIANKCRQLKGWTIGLTTRQDKYKQTEREKKTTKEEQNSTKEVRIKKTVSYRICTWSPQAIVATKISWVMCIFKVMHWAGSHSLASKVTRSCVLQPVFTCFFCDAHEWCRAAECVLLCCCSLLCVCEVLCGCWCLFGCTWTADVYWHSFICIQRVNMYSTETYDS